MPTIAITGGIACGKTLAGSILAEKGVAVYDTDDAAHAVMMPGNRAYECVIREFGDGILGSDGFIDRKILGEKVFAEGEALRRLNDIVHPEVKKLWKEWLKNTERETQTAAVIVPLLYECGEGTGWDAVICVSAVRETQIERLMARGLSREQCGKRIESQLDLEKKSALADHVLSNDGTVESLKEQTERVLANILEK
ncbi:MAG: dephospho-CoA kinase [Kiritimatiellia bacterium]